MRIAACASRDAAESFLPVIMPSKAAPAQALATHGVVAVAALVVATAMAGGGGDMWNGASDAQAEVATVDEVTIREVDMWVDPDGVQVRSSVPGVETEQSCVM
jgi:hypothetical protein